MSALIGVEELKESLGKTVILDARFRLADPSAAEKLFQEGHIPGAVRVDLDRDLSGPKNGLNGRHPLPDREQLESLFSRLGVGEHSQVVVYDDTDHAGACRAWMLLRYVGFEPVRVLSGGLEAWKKVGYSLEKGPGAKRKTATFRARAPLVEVRFLGDLGGAELFDARAPERYRGDVEPLDPVAGHIPGAKNLPYGTLMRDGKFLSAADLAAVLPKVAKPVFYCGSGVTACVPLFAAHLAGKTAAIYAGSWSEYCAQPGAKVEKG